MKTWFRIFGLASALTLATFATANAQQYGTCHVYCDEQWYQLDWVSYGQCCFNLNHFSNACYMVGWEWHPYEGDSLVCGG